MPTWKKIQFRPYNEKAAAEFEADIAAESWQSVCSASGSNAKADAFQRTLDSLMDLHFPYKTIRRKDTDLPWINEAALRKIRKKRAIYQSEGQSDRCYSMKDHVDKYLEKRQEEYLAKQRTNMTAPDASKLFFANVMSYNSAEKPKSFNVMDILPDKSEKEAAEEVATYFNRISDEFKPLKPWEVPTTYERFLPRLTMEQVQTRLRKAKKPKSMVEGDSFPRLINRCSPYIALSLADIFNTILETSVWPIAWKRKYVSVIPKKSLPSSLSELRNISCTKFFSKVFEGYVLQLAMEEISLKDKWFGGTKGCSTAHMLIEIWQNICENAEDYRSATTLAAIDYSKAFNRMSFQHCLRAFEKKDHRPPSCACCPLS